MIDKTKAVFVEYCINCRDHAWNTKHDEAKYLNFFQLLKEEIERELQGVTVYGNTNLKTGRSLAPKLGAFEVVFNGHVFFSKIKARSWPDVNNVLSEIKSFRSEEMFDDNYSRNAIQTPNQGTQHRGKKLPAIRPQQPPTPDLHSDESLPTVESDATMDFRKRRNHSPPPQSKRNKKRETYTPDSNYQENLRISQTHLMPKKQIPRNLVEKVARRVDVQVAYFDSNTRKAMFLDNHNFNVEDHDDLDRSALTHKGDLSHTLKHSPPTKYNRINASNLSGLGFYNQIEESSYFRGPNNNYFVPQAMNEYNSSRRKSDHYNGPSINAANGFDSHYDLSMINAITNEVRRELNIQRDRDMRHKQKPKQNISFDSIHGDRKNFLFESGEDSYPKLHEHENITKGYFLSPQYRANEGALKEISGAKQIIQHTHLLKIEKNLPINRINRNEEDPINSAKPNKSQRAFETEGDVNLAKVDFPEHLVSQIKVAKYETLKKKITINADLNRDCEITIYSSLPQVISLNSDKLLVRKGMDEKISIRIQHEGKSETRKGFIFLMKDGQPWRKILLKIDYI